MTPEPYTCDLDQDTETILKMYLFENVLNVKDIRNNIVQGKWNCAAIKPSLILDKFQVAVAANRAVVAEKTQTMVTRTPYAEILYNLSLTKNISQSLSKFGIEKGNNLLVCFLVKPGKDDCEEIVNQIDGDMCQISDLHKFTDMEDLKTAYKLSNLTEDVDLLDLIVSRMVTKNFVSY
ncbi:EKC/KEOPS complex subunit Tprkb-like [Epargyreus clarus]|uniref:EKC/KEOPS complex subunit Tprkb-like n=1 Tax=Epargyreus clarus TaxID=520877 RepID=UPI003C2C0BFF